ncbi:MAG TPA: hypothetical protein VK327_01490 [Candidatus Paceibacterota bacterium]|nr:hypothetical protein [Candidatus Paceibacterota bacterium]
MEIEFNVSNVGKPAPVPPVARQTPTRDVPAQAEFRAADLERMIKQLPMVRPEKVEQAKAMVADVKYPPEQVLRSLSTLLALKLAD